MLTFDQTKEILSHFGLVPISTRPFGSGNINDTYLIIAENGLYTLQGVNTSVFKDPYRLMDNITSVTSHILRALEAEGRTDQYTLEFLPTDNGSYLIECENRAYRVCKFIAAHSIDCPEKPEHLYEAGKAFGSFGRMLSDFDASKLYEVLPRFHDTADRYRLFEEAVQNGRPDRVEKTAEEIEFVRSRKHLSSLVVDGIAAGEIPLRVTHNDTKINNVLFDYDGNGLCVIDLDTVMPGYSVNDFGDSIRFGANTAVEDETDLSKVSLDLTLFEAYADGFLRGCGGKLTDKEVELLPVGAMMMTFECGMRFLTDYLEGDVYFRTHRPGHNLDRCRNQFALVADMERKLPEMQAIVRKLLG